MYKLENKLIWSIRILFGLLLFFTPLIISSSLFFPFITGKNFFFRIIVELMVGAWGALAVLNPIYRPRINFLFASIVAFIGSLTLATLFGASPYHSFWSNFERMEGLITYLHLFGLFVVLSGTLKTKREWAIFLHISLLASLFVGLYGVCEHVFYNDNIEPLTSLEEFCTTSSGGGRIFSTLGNFIYLAVFAMFNMFFSSILFYEAREKNSRLLFGGLFLFNLYIFFLAGSRGSTMGLFAGFFVMLCCALVVVRKPVYRFGLVGVLAAVIATPFLLRALHVDTLLPSSNLLSRLATISLHDIQDQPRFKIWKMGLRAFQERPMFGWGPENFIIPYAKYYDPTLYGNEPWFDRVHNMSLQWLVDAGIVGFAAYLCMLVAVFYTIMVCVRKKKLPFWIAVLFVGLLVAYIVQNLFVFDTITNYIYYFSLLAFLQVSISEERHQKRSQAQPGQLIGAACIILLGILTVFFFNVKQIEAASGLLNALSGARQAKSVDEIVLNFQKIFDLETFGSSEARERLAEIAVQAVQGADSPGLLLPLVDKSIVELTKEVNENPLVAKNIIFLAKLQSIKVSVTGKDATQAEESYQRALALAPLYPQTYLGLTEFYLITGQNEKAVITSTKVLELVPINVDLFYTILSSYVLGENYVGAKGLLEKYIGGKILPPYTAKENDQQIRVLIQRSLRTDKELASKIEFYKELNKQFDHPLLFVGFAQTYAQMGNKQKAREYALMAAKADPALQDQVDKFLKNIDALLQ